MYELSWPIMGGMLVAVVGLVVFLMYLRKKQND
jgi:hypothetical protein